ncbi:MAG TPA: hypothetical protein VNI83_03410 [Vicinamibacterales bacterium]|nr:hypothetical protein [Vicinamibacterales bacterium]
MHPRNAPPEKSALWQELSDALQIAAIYAGGLDRALCDTSWRIEARELLAAIRRATEAAARLRELAQSER